MTTLSSEQGVPKGGGAFFLAYSVLSLAIGLPLCYLLTMIGQFCGRGSLQGAKA